MMAERSFECEHDGTRFRLRRITDEEDEFDVRNRYLSIKDDYELYYWLVKQLKRDGERLLFSDLYASFHIRLSRWRILRTASRGRRRI